MHTNKTKSLPWNEVEQAINQEVKWLENTIIDSPFNTKKDCKMGVYKKGKRNLFVEVGTVSISKLLLNLESMEGSDILLVLDSKHAVEFSILDVDALGRFAQETHRKYHPLAEK